ncbi:SEC-C metal-binding domain-containing protein [Paenibacillus sp. WQ 127069]|uniref:SEC-C metal-binding domain-containing protein n=1 Tax=Paenibacillus baimaensis TaxID=2982185 RepID=A0ABT2UVH1_9BACL|nr:SEC-C metal-binding domain-containing protein [Paenibacillus sp. WQ 127069]MCU6798011.1 SEC-C metal-binding domain-containing protein [Paenibacillus sp. WQ 127069]
MDKIGRNDLCPCMSSKKYKQCCGLTGKWEFFKRSGYNYYYEPFVLNELLSGDEIFLNFYRSERKKIKKNVLFFQSNTMNSSASFGHIGDNREQHYIQTKNIQIPLDASFHIAHEIQHLILCDEGYKMLFLKDNISNSDSGLNKYFNDMIYDPIVNGRLKTFGFDLLNYLQSGDEVQEKALITNTTEEGMIWIATLYVKKFLDYKNLYPEILAHEVGFNKLIEKNYPELIPVCNDLLRIVEANGYQTPSEAEASLRATLDCLNFNHILILLDV